MGPGNLYWIRIATFQHTIPQKTGDLKSVIYRRLMDQFHIWIHGSESFLKPIKLIIWGSLCWNYRHLCPGASGRGETVVRNGSLWPRERPALLELKRYFSEIHCLTPCALRVWVVFSRKWASRSRPFAFFFRLRHLSSGSAIFDVFRKN